LRNTTEQINSNWSRFIYQLKLSKIYLTDLPMKKQAIIYQINLDSLNAYQELLSSMCIVVLFCANQFQLISLV